jgi:16S rRNA (uracil1498-N3)-methyltransferase
VSRYDFAAQRLFVDAPLAQGARVPLSREQANYLLNVLRLCAGDSVIIFNGQDGEWRAVVADTGRKAASLDIADMLRAQEAGPDVDYVFAPLKHARLDYMVQKAVEMGASRLRPALTRRTQAHRVNLERMRANVIEAAEQCGVLAIAQIEEPQPLEKLLAEWPQDRLLVFCDEDALVADPVAALRERAQPGTPVAVLIGPEGGFDPAERAMLMGMKQTLAISLGPRILRADTAAVAALALVNTALGEYAQLKG